ncbi:MAG: hypothetical protein U0359_13360 [Byssovorax sp.]
MELRARPGPLGSAARLAAIDIGSNALRLRVADVDPPRSGPEGVRFGAFREVLAERAPVRLGAEVFTGGAIARSGLHAACNALRRFAGSMRSAGVERYRAVATAAVREAENRARFIDQARRRAGVLVEPIDGGEEARLIELAVRERVAIGDRAALLVDIGGGSTELTLLDRGAQVFACSLPIGTVRLLHAVRDEGQGRLGDASREILDELIALTASPSIAAIKALAPGRIGLLLGTGGNVETLADLCPYQGDLGATRGIDIPRARALLFVLGPLSLAERVARFGLRPDRADTILTAALILCGLGESLGVPAIGVPGVGLKEGVLLDLAHSHFAAGPPLRC